ncbi:MAG: flavin reductase [bacterium]|nr:flavin reductase [bacterium]
MNTKILRSISYGVYIVTSMDEGRPVGCTANSIMQITSEPQTVAISLNHANYTNEVVKRTGKVAVSILSEESDSSLIGGFGFRSSRDANKFEGVDYAVWEDLPILLDTCGWMTLKVIDSIETSTHTVFICEMTDGEMIGSKRPMTYAYYHEVIKGRAPKTAPTYIPELDGDAAPAAEAAEKWICSICKYEYDGDVPFEDLPDDWVCPICGQPKSVFKKG